MGHATVEVIVMKPKRFSLEQSTQFGRDGASEHIVAQIHIANVAKLSNLGGYGAGETVAFEEQILEVEEVVEFIG